MLSGRPRPPRDAARPACGARHRVGNPGPGQYGRTGFRCDTPAPQPIPTSRGPLAQPPDCLRRRVPDGSEDLQNVGARDPRHRHPSDAREGVPFDARHPVAGVCLSSPVGLHLFHRTQIGFVEARHALHMALFGAHVAALAGQFAVAGRLLKVRSERVEKERRRTFRLTSNQRIPG